MKDKAKYLPYILKPAFGLILLLMLYFLMAFILGLIPVNRNYIPAKEGIVIYVTSNGVHTDFIVPVRTVQQDWSEWLPYAHFDGADSTFRYVSFGWGDKGFYIETPTWDDLTVTTAFKALFLPTPTVMHTEYFWREPQPRKRQERLVLTEEQYARLIDYVQQHFQKGPDGQYILIEGAGYDVMDNFYEAHGKYHLFRTSNSWTNKGLKKIGVRTAVWSPFDLAILYQLRKANQRARRGDNL